MEHTQAKTVSAYHPVKYLAAAFFVSAFLWAVQSSGGYDADVAPIALAMFGVAAMLTFMPVAQSYAVAAVQDGASRSDRMLGNLMYGMVVMATVRLIDWTGTDTFQWHVAWLLTSGLVMALLFHLFQPPFPSPAEREVYLDDAELSRRHRQFLRVWPLVCPVIWLALAFFQPERGWSEVQQLVFLILFPALFLRLRPRPGLGLANPQLLQAAGLIVLACAIISALG